MEWNFLSWSTSSWFEYTYFKNSPADSSLLDDWQIANFIDNSSIKLGVNYAVAIVNQVFDSSKCS